MNKLILLTILVGVTWAHIECSSDSDCAHKILQKSCCLEAGVSRCHTHCVFGGVDTADSMDAFILGYQSGAHKSLSTRYSCMQPYINEKTINAKLQNAYLYGAQGGYYMPS